MKRAVRKRQAGRQAAEEKCKSRQVGVGEGGRQKRSSKKAAGRQAACVQQAAASYACKSSSSSGERDRRREGQAWSVFMGKGGVPGEVMLMLYMQGKACHMLLHAMFPCLDEMVFWAGIREDTHLKSTDPVMRIFAMLSGEGIWQVGR